MADELRIINREACLGGDGWRTPIGIPSSCRTCYWGEVRASPNQRKEIDLAELAEVTSAAKDRDSPSARTFEGGGCHYQHVFAGGTGSPKERHSTRNGFAAGRIAWGRAILEHFGGTLRIPKSRTVGGSQRDAAGDSDISCR